VSNTHPSKTYSRRRFLKQAFMISATAGLLAACSSQSNTAAEAALCEGEESLSIADQTTRQAVGYVDQAADAGKTCANCRFFQQSTAEAGCGSCEVVKGPIAPGGYCTTWVAQAAD
jgi:hypothetical protein